MQQKCGRFLAAVRGGLCGELLLLAGRANARTISIAPRRSKRSSTKPVEDLTSILDAFAAFKGGPLCHTFGNHEVSAISRAELLPMMGIPPPETTAACGGNGSIANSAGAAAAAASAGAGAAPDSEEPPAPSAVTLSASTSTRSHPPHEAGAGYFDLLLDGGVRLVALDTYDAAMAG